MYSESCIHLDFIAESVNILNYGIDLCLGIALT